MKHPQSREGLVFEEGSIFDRSQPGRCATDFPVGSDELIQAVDQGTPKNLKRKTPAELPECSELEVVRHFTRLSSWNYNIDAGFYPLGSCTMKYNPRVHETVASMDAFRRLHPGQPDETSQGTLHIMYMLTQWLEEISGMKAVTLQPAAGAHGEWTGLKMIAAYFKEKKSPQKTTVLIPDSAHGTNPASAAMCGFQTKTIPTPASGVLRFEDVLPHITDDIAAMMVTNPNTLGLFEKDIHKIAEALKKKDAFLYIDGANLNALLGVIRPGDFGADVLQINLHKTFSTPHGGGGPGSGPVGVSERLVPYLPVPFVTKKDGGTYALSSARPRSIGPVKAYFGQFGMFIRAYAYILAFGREHLSSIGRDAVLNANYLLSLLRKDFEYTFGETCMHEFVLTDKSFKATGVSTLDMAKALIDNGYHPPTIYFPLVVSGALMIEPTETESKQELDRFASTMKELLQKARQSPEAFQNLPARSFIRKVDEANAARKLCLCDPE